MVNRIAVFTILMLVGSSVAQDGFHESFNGSGLHSSVQRWNEFSGEFFGQVIERLDEPDWFFNSKGEGELTGAGYRFFVNPTDADREQFRVGVVERPVDAENSNGFVERVEIRDFHLEDDDSDATSSNFALSHLLGSKSNLLSTIVKNTGSRDEESEDSWMLYLAPGNGRPELVAPGNNIALEQILYQRRANNSAMVEFTYDNDIEDENPAVRFGPFVLDGTVTEMQTTRIWMGATGLNSIISGTLDNWSMQEVTEFAKGDFNFDGQIDHVDIDILTNDIRSTSEYALRDLTSDNLTNSEDQRAWIVDIKGTWVGDSNLDGEFNSADLVAVFQAGEYEDQIIGNSGWTEGDWNGSGDFDSSDLVFAFEENGYEAGQREVAHNVPEPAHGEIILLAIMLFLRLRLRSFATQL